MTDDAAEPGGQGIQRWRKRGFEALPRRSAQARALQRVGAEEEPEEAQRVPERELRLGDRQRRGDLLLPGKEGDGVDERDPEELLGQDTFDIG